MGQIRSYVLHKIPYSMVWENSLLSHTNQWHFLVASKISESFLNKMLNYSVFMDNKNWVWADGFFCVKSYYKLFENENYINELGALNRRFYYSTFHKKNILLLNSNKGSNAAVGGKINFFQLKNKFYCLNSYYSNLVKKLKLKYSDPMKLIKKKIKNDNKFKKINMIKKYSFGLFLNTTTPRIFIKRKIRYLKYFTQRNEKLLYKKINLFKKKFIETQSLTKYKSFNLFKKNYFSNYNNFLNKLKKYTFFFKKNINPLLNFVITKCPWFKNYIVNRIISFKKKNMFPTYHFTIDAKTLIKKKF